MPYSIRPSRRNLAPFLVAFALVNGCATTGHDKTISEVAPKAAIPPGAEILAANTVRENEFNDWLPGETGYYDESGNFVDQPPTVVYAPGDEGDRFSDNSSLSSRAGRYGNSYIVRDPITGREYIVHGSVGDPRLWPSSYSPAYPISTRRSRDTTIQQAPPSPQPRPVREPVTTRAPASMPSASSQRSGASQPAPSSRGRRNTGNSRQ